MLPAVFLVALSLTGSNATMAVVILTLAVTMIGAFASGFYQCPMDVAPNFAGREDRHISMDACKVALYNVLQ